MKILLITPAPPRSRAGNRATAVRWARILKALGHRAVIAGRYDGQACDALLALHAWRSSEAVQAFAERHPDKPLIVALTGTDLYRYLQSHPQATGRSIELADRLVALHARAYTVLPASAATKFYVIYQSADAPPRGLQPSKQHFDVCVAGHLRAEKDPLRTALAVRGLPTASRIRILHYGKAHDAEWAAAARAEMAQNPRYHWLGEVPHWQVRRAYSRCRLMVLSSTMEGGANVISEAARAGLPVIASDIAGSIGLLGADYAGYYPVGDSAALGALLQRAEREPAFLSALKTQVEALAPLFTLEAEIAGWRGLLAGLG